MTMCGRCGSERDSSGACPRCGEAAHDALSSPTIEIDAGSGEVLDGRFRVGRLIARGGMGEVCEGLDLSLGRTVAIKFLAPRFQSDPEVVARFRREAEALASLAHPNVVPVHAVGEDAGRPYFVMTLIGGRTLEQIVRAHGPLPVGAAVHVGVQVCRGLTRVHDAGYVHRDIKPSNLMIDDSGHCVLLDFGILREVESRLTVTGYIVGTPEYMSPEQARAARLAEPRSDLYSLGATLYAALTGTPPFVGESSYEIINQHHSARALPPSARVRGLPRAVDAFFRTALAKEPAQRFADAAAMSDALSALAAPAWTLPTRAAATVGGGDSEVRGELRERTHASMRRRRRTWLAAAFVVAAAATIAIVLARPFGGDEAGVPRARTPAATSSFVATAPAPAPTVIPRAVEPPAVPRSPLPVETPPPRATAERKPGRSRAAVEPPEAETDDDGEPARRAPAAPPARAKPLAATPRTEPPSSPAALAPASEAQRPALRATDAPGMLRIVTLHQGEVAWAEVAIDGAPIGTSPIARHKVRAGRHTIVATRAGYRAARKTIELRAGETRKVTIELERESP